MEFTDEKKQIVREAIHIIHDTCAEHEDLSKCPPCPFWNGEEKKCIFDDAPDCWPLSKKTPAHWNYLDECEEEEND